MKVKLFFKYFFEFIMGIVITLLALLLVFKFTILNESYLLDKIEENNYYEKLSSTIKEEMSYYVVQTGLSEEVLDNVFTKEMLEKDVKSVINSFYTNKKFVVNTEMVRKNIETNINNYLQNNNKVVSDTSSLNQFIDQVVDIYKTSLDFAINLEEISPYVYKINNILNYVIIACVVFIIISALCLAIFMKEVPLSISMFTFGILFVLAYFLIKAYIDIDNIVFYDENISNIIKVVFNDIIDKIKLFGIIGFILGIISSASNGIIKHKKS